MEIVSMDGGGEPEVEASLRGASDGQPPDKKLKKSQIIESNKKYALGHRAFLLFLFPRMKWLVLLFAITLGIWYAERWVPPGDALWGFYVAHLLFAISCSIFALILVETYLEYRYYTYLFTDDAFIMTYGYVVRNEIATLYHHIQNVNIERSVLDRAIGVSKLIILMTGSDRAAGRNQMVLPAIGKRRAKLVQNELLKRARRHADAHPEED